MSRLYYPPARRSGVSPAANMTNETKEYFEKVAKFVPAEIIAAFIAIIGLVPAINDDKLEHITLWVVFGLGVIGTPLYLRSLADKDKPMQRQLIVSTIAFVVWSYSIAGYLVPSIYNAALASIVLIVFSVVSGRIPV